MRNKNSLRLKIRQQKFTEHGATYTSWLVFGYAPDGKRIRKQFEDHGEASAWASAEEIRQLNSEATRRPSLTSLTPDQLDAAERAFARLAGKGTLAEAVDCFVATDRRTANRTTLKKAIVDFLTHKQSSGVRERTLVQLKSVLELFASKFGELKYVDEVTTASCESFLGSRGKAAKTWNNYRADLHNFFEHARSKATRWCTTNPAAEIEKRKIDGRGMPAALTSDEAAKLMGDAENFEGGALVPFLALALFAGVRSGPGGELYKLMSAPQRPSWIDEAVGIIHIQPNVSKTREYRQTRIRPNLAAWLKAYPVGPLPRNFDRLIKGFRALHKLSHDVLRHTFFSMHVGAFGSVADAALEGGNTESICRRHYLNLTAKGTSLLFWEICPKKVHTAKAAA